MLLQRNPRGGYDVLDAQRRYMGWTPNILKARRLVSHPSAPIGLAGGFIGRIKGRVCSGWTWKGQTTVTNGVRFGAAYLDSRIWIDLRTGEVFRRDNRRRGEIKIVRRR